MLLSREFLTRIEMKVLKVVLSSMILLAQLSCSKGVGEASSKETKEEKKPAKKMGTPNLRGRKDAV